MNLDFAAVVVTLKRMRRLAANPQPRARLTCAACLLLLASAQAQRSDQVDISSGGQPTITGSIGGSVVGGSNLMDDLVVTINLGELSPANPNNQVRVVVPVALRTSQPYELSVTVAGVGSPDPNGVQLTDIGFGIQNIRNMQGQNNACNIVTAPFFNDPNAARTINPATGRAVYPSTAAHIGNGLVLMRGSKLSRGFLVNPRKNNLTNG